MYSNSFNAYCPDAVYAADPAFELRLVVRRGEIISHRLKLETERARFESLDLYSTCILEGAPEPDWIYFNIRKELESTLLVNRSAIKRGLHALVITAGDSFVASMPEGYSSYGIGIHRKLLEDSVDYSPAYSRLLGVTGIYEINHQLFQCINRELRHIEQAMADALTLDGRLAELFLTVLANLDKSSVIGTTNRQRIVCNAIHHIRNTNRRVSPLELAERVHCSPRTLQYAFRKTYGISPKKFVDRYRLCQVHALLKETGAVSMKIQDIAQEFGFTHAGNFSRSYQELFRRRPSETFRQSFR